LLATLLGLIGAGGNVEGNAFGSVGVECQERAELTRTKRLK
jgi:hypothetical protein